MEALIARRLAKKAAADALDLQYESDAEIFIRQVSSDNMTALLGLKTKTPKCQELEDDINPIASLRSTDPSHAGIVAALPSDDSELEGALLHSRHGKALENRLTNLVAAFRARSLQAKHVISEPPVRYQEPKIFPEQVPTLLIGHPDYHVASVSELDQANPPLSLPVVITFGKLRLRVPELFFKIPRPPALDPHSLVHLIWLALVSLAFLYSAIVIPYRAAFPVQTSENLAIWLTIDYFCDFIYVVDLLIWKSTIKIQVHGIEESNKKEIFRNYVTTTEFRLDLFALAPLDLFYLIGNIGINPLLRIPRLLHIHSYWKLMDRIDQISTNPYYFRVMRTFSYMLYIIHINACFYYYFSYLRGFDPNNDFVYNNVHPECQNKTRPNLKCTFPGEYNDYVFCFFFSVSMITIIGNLNVPGLLSEMIYSMILWFVGVFIFATLVGQIRDVLRAKTRQEDEFYEMMDSVTDHMQTLKIPKELQSRVRSWLLYNWEQQGTTDESRLLVGLPSKLRSDIAMQVHYSTIHKVQLLRHIDKKVVEELLLRLRPSVYLPGDYICRRGEIGKEMFIIKSGLLEVILPDGRMAVTLGPGSVFGEISLLALAGGNRRTADVRSKGFSNIYVLKKADLNDVMKDYPEQLELLKSKSKELFNKGKMTENPPSSPQPVEVIHARPETPIMVRVALSVLKADSPIRRRLNQPQFEFTQPDHRDSESEVEKPTELLTNRGTSRSSGVQSKLKVKENVKMQEIHRTPVYAMDTDIMVTPHRRRKRSRSRSRSPRTLAMAELDHSSPDSDIGEAKSSIRLRPVNIERGYPPRTLPLTSLNVQESELPISIQPIVRNKSPLERLGKVNGGRSWSLINLLESRNLNFLQKHFFRQPKIMPLRVNSEANLPAVQTTKNGSGIFDFGPVVGPHRQIGDKAPTLSTSDIDEFHLSDSYDDVNFSSSDSP